LWKCAKTFILCKSVITVIRVCKVTHPAAAVDDSEAHDATPERCRGDVIKYISRHIDVSYEVLANYDDDDQEASSRPRLRGRFNLTNTGTRTLRRGLWELYIPSSRAMQLDDSGTMLANSGLKASIQRQRQYKRYTFYVQNT